MRLYESDAEPHEGDGMDGPSRIREWMKATLERDGLTVDGWAKLAGVHKSTIHRALKDDYAFVTSSRTLNRLAQAAGVSPPDVLSQVKLELRFLPVRYSVQAGLWYEIDAEEPPEHRSVAVAPHPAFERFPQWLEKVVGDSVDLKIPAGHYAHVVDAQEMGYAPRHGDWVVVERRRDQGCVRERTIKQIEMSEGRVALWPRSRNPKWSEPVDLAAGARPGDTEVQIVGLVIGAYDPDFNI